MQKFLLTASAVALTATGAFAGGFERSGNPIGFMFEAGNYAELSFGIVSPSVDGAAAGGLAPTGDVSPSYRQLSFAVKTDLNDKISLGLQIDPTFGANIDYALPSPGPGPYPIAGTNAELNGDTLAVVARYKFNDSFSAHAGLRSVSVGGNVAIFNGGAPVYQASFDTDRDIGYMLGAAFEKKDIALRVALTYQSSTTHTLESTVFGGPVPSALYPEVELPQSVTLDFQSGVAANTLVFGSIRWADWTATELNAPAYPLNPLVGYSDDSWTYNIGVGRKFNDQWSGAVSIGYEKSSGDIQMNLSPTDGYVSLGVGATYTSGNMKITGGVRYVDIGDAGALESPLAPGVANAQFEGNSAIAAGIKIGYTF
ncbi:MAG: OmpP1/FadL family transporter [Paracoccaceae bacterium]